MLKYFAILFLGCVSFAVSAEDSADSDSRGLARKPETTFTTPFLQGTFRALIIGNDNYRDPKRAWGKLKTARRDAIALADLLNSTYGFTDVTLLTDASSRTIVLAFQELARRTQPNDSVLIYYAGHGYMDEENKRGYWIPVDAVGKDISTFVRNSTIRDEMQALSEKAHHTLLISDSCFSGSLLRGGNRGVSKLDDGDPYYEKTAKKKSVQVLASGGLEFVDDNYKNSGHSPFTYFLLNELQNNTRPVFSMNEFATSVAKAVANNVRQTPEVGVLYGSGDELGEFIFARVSGYGKVDISVQRQPTETPRISINTVEMASDPDEAWAPMPRF